MVSKIFIKRIGFTLIRVHRQQLYSTSNASDEVLLQQLKWPVETLFVGMKMEDYNSSTEATRRLYLDRWHKFSKVDMDSFGQTGFNNYKKSVLTGATVSLAIAGNIGRVTGVGTDFDGTVAGGNAEIIANEYIVINGHPFKVLSVAGPTILEVGGMAATNAQPLPIIGVVGADNFYKYTLAPQTATVQTCTPTLDSLSIIAHGIPIYNDFPSTFFNAYMPYHYGGPSIKTPADCGALMIPFNIYPGTYQPSGRCGRRRTAISA